MAKPTTQLERIQDAFEQVCEAEAIQAAGVKDETYWLLIEAHSALLKARDLERARGRRRNPRCVHEALGEHRCLYEDDHNAFLDQEARKVYVGQEEFDVDDEGLRIGVD